MTDIFLSYNREDQTRAKLFAEGFEAKGFKVWWDVGLRTGEAYDEVTEMALRTAKAVVVLWSKKSVQSRWVRAEATLADRNKTLVPCMIEPCERPIMFELTQTAELSDWHGDAFDRAWVAFLADVHRFVTKEAAPAASITPVAAPTVEETLKPGQSGSAPSLAVLPFTNRSHLPDDDIFAHGMVEDIIWALSQGVNVRVLGSSATANLSSAAISDLAFLGNQLGVRYLLEGNVRRVGANLRVTTQLLEIETGAVVWASRFDRPLAELAELQEELVTDIAAALDTQVYRQEVERTLSKPSDITAWEADARALYAYRKWDAAALVEGVQHAKRAFEIAPGHAPARATFAAALANAYFAVSPDDPSEVQRIRALAESALALAPDDALVLSNSGVALSYIGHPEEGAPCTGRAVRKAPGSGLLHLYHGVACTMLNNPEVGLSHLKTAERLMPGSHMMWVVKNWQSGAYRELGRLTEAEAARDQSISIDPKLAINHVFKALLCLDLGRETEARKCIQTARRLGWEVAQAEHRWRRLFPNSPRLQDDIAILRALFTEAQSDR